MSSVAELEKELLGLKACLQHMRQEHRATRGKNDGLKSQVAEMERMMGQANRDVQAIATNRNKLYVRRLEQFACIGLEYSEAQIRRLKITAPVPMQQPDPVEDPHHEREQATTFSG